MIMNIRSHTTLVGVFPVISYAGTTGPSSLGLRMTEFAGKFTLPFDAAWGEMLLPEGDYALYYGALGEGVHCVEILGVEQGTPRGMFLVREQDPASVVQNALICSCTSGRHIIRTLELPAIGKAISFAGPNARRLVKKRRSRTRRQVAGAPA
jgi:hypothetical protein